MPRKKKEPEDLSLDQIQEQLAQIEAEKKMLELALQKRRSVALADFVKDIRDQIVGRGYTVDEVFAQLRKGRRKASAAGRSAEYPRYVDPDNPERGYTRGPLPAWLRQKMEAEGYDATDRAQREAFKSNYLKQVA
jgi:DNA-binding protein H-NS